MGLWRQLRIPEKCQANIYADGAPLALTRDGSWPACYYELSADSMPREIVPMTLPIDRPRGERSSPPTIDRP